MALRHPWGAYRALQEELDERTQVDSQAWGLEEALNTLLETGATVTTVRLNRVRNAASRRERHRAHVRVLRVVQTDPPAVDLEHRAAEARETLDFLQTRVEAEDWALLQAVAEGQSYATIAKARGVTEVSLRVRVSRMREVLKRAA
jgi:DNA-directed RNA polymerase specialized sigma24 family protein